MKDKERLGPAVSETHVSNSKIDHYLESIFKNAPKNYPENIKRLVRQAIINLDYFVESEEFSQYCFPALRALEGHIKYLITAAGGRTSHSFSEFNKDPRTGRYIFVEHVRDERLKPHIERCYNYYKSVRDTTIHFGDIFGRSDSTRMIESKEDADEIIRKCISLIRLG